MELVCVMLLRIVLLLLVLGSAHYSRLLNRFSFPVSLVYSFIVFCGVCYGKLSLFPLYGRSFCGVFSLLTPPLRFSRGGALPHKVTIYWHNWGLLSLRRISS